MVVLRRLGLALLLSAVSLRVPAQSILTIAGGGSVDGQLVSDIPTLGPQGIAFDHRGDVYLALYYAGQVLKIDATTRTVKVVAGNGASGFSGDGGPATAATLRQPAGIILDANDNLYIADTGNNRVRRVDANSGIIETLAGGGTPADGIGDGGPATAAIVGRPWGVAVFGGSLYITEQNFDANRVRRVNLAAGVIDTVAGSTDGSRGGFAGDGGPAKDAQLDTPYGIVVDAEGNLFVADSGNNRVRRIDANGVITTYAGGGATGTFDDGIPATQADLSTVTALSIAKDGSLLLASFPRVRRIDKATGVITTIVPYAGLLYGLATAADGTIYFDDGGVFTLAPGATDPVQFAGSGNYVGDGKPAKAAILHSPQGLALDHSGNLYIADSAGNIVRRVSAADGTMTTVAGTVGAFYSQEQEGADATKAVVGFPVDVAFDGAGNLYVADQLNQRIWRIDPAGKITTDAGGGSPADGVGDGGAATAANFVPVAIAFDAAGNLYIADTDPYSTPPHARVRKVDAATKVITTVAGSANLGYAGDGGPATAAHLQQPFGVAVDDDGSLLISDYGNGAIRRVDRDGIISTIAGSPDRSAGDPLGDEGPASAARLSPLHLTVDRATGDILVADGSSHRVRRIDPAGIIHTVAGSDNFYYEGGFSGDNGRATEAKLSFDYGDLSGVAVAANGDLYLSDSQNNRVRAVFACVPVAAPSITNVPDGAASPTLEWSPVAGAFRYDVRLDIVTPPVRVIASDLTETSFAPANLAPGTTYFWNVTAKGDPFCAAVSAASSAVSSFTTAAGCSAGAFDLIAPADGAAGSIAALSWQPAAGAGTYDLHLGSTNPPPLFESGLTATTHAVPDIPGLVYWFVVAHAACDPAKTSNTPIRAYTASAAPLCGAVPVVTAIAPGAGAADVPTTTILRWSVSQISAPIDVYFGTVSDPPLFQSGLPASTTSISLPPLDPGTTYFWRVVAGCASPLSTPAVSFTTRAGCTAPQGVQILFAPSSVSAGATYAIVWSAADGLDLGGGYLVERSTSPSFATILDSQVAGSTAASFVAGAPGTYYHRVRAVPGCDPSRSGPVSANAGVRVVDAPANIIVTVPPEAVVTALGEKLENHSGSFTIENIGSAPAQIIVGQSELPGSRPFFSIAEGGAFVTLQPGLPRTFTIRYSGPPNDLAASYQGVIFAVGVNQPLPVTPYAFVNLKVGGGPAATPEFLVGGTAGEYAAFPGFSGNDDSARPALEIGIRNPGTTPMELGAEIGPEVWLVPEDGWNAQPVAPGATRTVKLFTRRPFAPNGSPLPRYTYFTVRTKDGASSRLLVQDNDRVNLSSGRATSLEATARSFIVAGAAARLRLTNQGGDAVQTELIFTPGGSDGFDPAAVKRAAVVVPPNDVVTLTDPATQLFGSASGTTGQIEVRIPRERLGLIAVTASVPVVARGTGARTGAPNVIDLPVPAPTTLTLAETSGADHAAVSISTGSQTFTADLQRYGTQQIAVGSPSRIEIDVAAGGGSVVGVAAAGTATFLSRTLNDVGAFKAAKHALDTAPSVTTVVPVISSISSAGAAPALQTAVGFFAQSSAANFLVTFHPASGGSLDQSVAVPAGGSTVYRDVLHDLFGLDGPADGNLSIKTPPNGKVYAVLQAATGGGASVPASPLPLPTRFSEAITGASGAALRPLFYDGLEQSVDPTRGSRWLLLLDEVGGGGGSVNVRLYEAGNRSLPIADHDFTIAANQQLKLDTVFASLGLDAADRRKDRTNVEVVVTARSGTAQVAASAVSVDNRTGQTKVNALMPAIGSGTPNVSFVAPVITALPSQGRHRAVGH